MEQLNISMISLVVSFLGGGIMSALINWIRVERSEKKERKARYLDEQIRNLYGPLYFLTSQSEKLFEIERKFQEAYKVEFIDKQYSQDPLTRERLREDTDKVLKIRNEYVSCVADNNLKIKEILDENFSFIDPDDIKLFIDYFYEHFSRLNIEKTEKVPLYIHTIVGDISFLRPEFIRGVKERFLEKKKELDKLLTA